MSVAGKLQIKPEHSVVVLHSPAGVDLGLDLSVDPGTADAVVVFVTTSDDLDSPEAGAAVAAAKRDALAWVAYPKAGKLGTDLNRDSLAARLTERGVRPVRQIAIDDVWSALRCRPGA